MLKNSRVVRLVSRHTHMSRSDEMITYQLGNATVHIDEYHVHNQTDEQRQERDAQIGLIAYEIEQNLLGETA